MDLIGAVRARLRADAAVTAIVTAETGRIAVVTRPQAGKLPAITLQTISQPRAETMKGLETLRFARVQVDCWATSSVEASRLADAAVAALQPRAAAEGWSFLPASVEGPRDLGEEVAGLGFVHRKSIDFRIRARPVA